MRAHADLVQTPQAPVPPTDRPDRGRADGRHGLVRRDRASIAARGAQPRRSGRRAGSGRSRRRGGAVDLDRIGGAIETWTANLERDPADFIAAVNLSGLYLTRGGLTASADDYDRALAAVDQALETDASLLGARIMRARVLFGSHDFARRCPRGDRPAVR